MLLTCGFLAGCGAGRTLVLNPVACDHAARGITIVADVSAAPTPPEVLKQFETLLSNRLYKTEKMMVSNDLVLKFRFIQYNPGSRFKRWMLGGIGNSGEGSLTIEVTYFDACGKEIGKIHSQGCIGSGVFGGAIGDALETAVGEIAQYTTASFPTLAVKTHP